MRRLFDLWKRIGIVPAAGVPDDELLRRFARDGDHDAFAALVTRYGPLVYGACRRLLPDPLDVEDAFQAAFIVLVRRAGAVRGRPVGPWLHRVAMLTARSLRRRNAVRLAAVGPLAETPARPTDTDARLDVDAALSALPRKYREPVILCHLQGWTRRELADHLGCPESTAASLVARGLAKLRRRLAGREPAAVLAAAAPAVVPSALAVSTTRAAIQYSTSFSAAAVPPTVAALANGVLHMVRMKQLAAVVAITVAAVAALAIGAGLFAGPTVPVSAQPGPSSQPPDERARVEQELEAARRRVAELETERTLLAAAEENAPRLLIEVGSGPAPRIMVTEFKTGGKSVGSVETTSPEMLARFVSRSRNDPAGPKTLKVHFDPECPEAVRKEIASAVRARANDTPVLPVRELAPIPVKDGLSPYVIEAPDTLLIEVVVQRKGVGGPVTERLPLHPISGLFQVRMDGTVGLGVWGSVSVAGRTLNEAAAAIRSRLAAHAALKDQRHITDALVVMVDVVAYNSKRYYVIVDEGAAELVYPFPITGSDAVLDALGKLRDVQVTIRPDTKIWVARKGKEGTEPQILPVDWSGITTKGITHTNYQLLPGDRIYVKSKK
ncbi:sigma-70 family RNA polymerase sigma factor [Gemmata sp. JC673]|uniref:Sigma-70 family RNA polymerase sigma factor n=1 Tax=Gemmata algarum TaxID=2975278 RepID=A0ABU5F8X0_9BACT|nr:sigma-70 family RNA polymerase sigma factor [Gemmata algarum]MDY3562843.1 sigma-70 family RNA polymerase sigma factor [Gemmata algarum]